MEQQKGFSLLEVLITLVLVSTLGLSLLAQQGQIKQLLTQSLLRADASQFLDQIDESLYLGVKKLPQPTPPYSFVLQKNKDYTILTLNWFQDSASLVRKRISVRTLK